MDIVLVCCWWLVKGVARPPMLCVAQNHRLQAHRHCCLTWIFCVKWNMRDLQVLYLPFPQIVKKKSLPSKNESAPNGLNWDN